MEKICLGIKLNARTAGSKAKEDISAILSRFGYTRMDYEIGKTRLQQMIIPKIFLKKVKRIADNAVVVFQYPFAGKLEGLFADFFDQRKDLKLITLIHDVAFLRDGSSDAVEERLMNRSDCVIVHNEEMKRAFVNHGFQKEKLISLEIFDYLSNTCPIDKEKNSKKIVIAGNLDRNKCGYVYRLSELEGSLTYFLYGIHFSGEIDDNIHYCGSFSPERLPGVLDGGFGLVWDGDDIETCSGRFGNYLRYNNPHKVSLYLASGIPVIVWKESAIAKYVCENGVGIAVSSLKEIKDAIASIPQNEYWKMVENAKQLSDKLLSGFYTIQAIRKAEAKV